MFRVCAPVVFLSFSLQLWHRYSRTGVIFKFYTNKIDFCPDSGTASICIYHLSASVRYRHRPIAAAKRGEKTVIFDFCVRFDIDSKGRNVGFGVNLPFYLKLKAVYHLSGKLRTALKLKCCLKAISLVRVQLILSRYRI